MDLQRNSARGFDRSFQSHRCRPVGSACPIGRRTLRPPFCRACGPGICTRVARSISRYSNEVWNFLFQQTSYAGEMGRKMGFKRDARTVLCYYRSVEIFRFWEKAFGGTNRLIRVMASQAANPWTSEIKLSFRDAYNPATLWNRALLFFEPQHPARIRTRPRYPDGRSTKF